MDTAWSSTDAWRPSVLRARGLGFRFKGLGGTLSAWADPPCLTQLLCDDSSAKHQPRPDACCSWHPGHPLETGRSLIRWSKPVISHPAHSLAPQPPGSHPADTFVHACPPEHTSSVSTWASRSFQPPWDQAAQECRRWHASNSLALSTRHAQRSITQACLQTSLPPACNPSSK